MEQTTISVRRHRDPDGLPTCCGNHPAGEACRFLGTRNFGTVDVCMMGEQRDLEPRSVDGCLCPHARCEVWHQMPAGTAILGPVEKREEL